jgi:uncharacterized protein YydD (DUF2326 family)
MQNEKRSRKKHIKMCNVSREQFAELEARFEQAQQLCNKLEDDIKQLKQYVVELESFIYGQGYKIDYCLVADVVGLTFQKVR